MDASIRVGSIRGIQLEIHWSWLVVFALIVWTLASGIFPEQNPGLSDGTYVAMAIVAAVLFFASIVAHEVGHAIQARREGMQIDGITLWLFGGIARFQRGFPSAGAEFRVAIAGPVVSLVIGLVCVGIARASLPETVDGVAAWLGYTNLALLVFNLIPALPLDGGRVLRSLLWKAKGDFRWATHIASYVGQAIAFMLIAGGLFLFIFQGAFSGAWLAFIGWFLLLAAGEERRLAQMREAYSGLPVSDLMVTDPVTVEPRLTLGQVMDEVFHAHPHTTYPVVEDGTTVGLLPLTRLSQIDRSEWDERRVRDHMLPIDQVPRVQGDASAAEALAKLTADSVGRALVLDKGRLTGLVSISDIAHALEGGAHDRRRRRSHRGDRQAAS